jgi:hypothetical protein
VIYRRTEKRRAYYLSNITTRVYLVATRSIAHQAGIVRKRFIIDLVYRNFAIAYLAAILIVLDKDFCLDYSRFNTVIAIATYTCLLTIILFRILILLEYSDLLELISLNKAMGIVDRAL